MLSRTVVTAAFLALITWSGLDAQTLRAGVVTGYSVAIPDDQLSHVLGAQLRSGSPDGFMLRADAVWSADRIFVLPAVAVPGPALQEVQTYLFAGPGAAVEFQRLYPAVHGGVGAESSLGRNMTVAFELSLLHLRAGPGLTYLPVRVGVTLPIS